jgi:transglutaminase-like putative cysteine protease
MVVQSHRLYPSLCDSQDIIAWEVSCESAEFGGYFFDGFGDRIRTMTLNKLSDEIEVVVSGTVKTTDNNGIMKIHNDKIFPSVFLRHTNFTEPNEELRGHADKALASDINNELDQCHALSHYIHQELDYVPGMTDSTVTASQAFALGKGVCQDQSHCLIALARIANIPARYVVGYLYSSDDQLQHNASHAWVELYVNGLGWVGFDPTNQCCVDEKYVRLGSGLDAHEAALIRGVSRGVGAENLSTSVKIQQVQQ